MFPFTIHSRFYTKLLISTVLSLAVLHSSFSQIVFPGQDSSSSSSSSRINSGSPSDANNTILSLDDTLAGAVNHDRLDHNSAAFYRGLSDKFLPRCSLPTGGQGQCVRLFQCPYMIPFVSRLRDPQTFNFVRQHICSIIGRTVFLCCPNQASPLPTFGVSASPGQTFPSQTSPAISVQPAVPLQSAVPFQPAVPQQPAIPFQPAAPLQPAGPLTPQSVLSFPSLSSTTSLGSTSSGGFNSDQSFNRPGSTNSGGFIPGQSSSDPTRLTSTGVANSFNGADLSVGDCGRSNVPFIVGGRSTAPGSYPWLAAVGAPARDGVRFIVACGGSLITAQYVISAAHCFTELPLTHVRLGEHDITSNRDGVQPQDFRILRHINPGYNTATKLNDIELLQLDRTVNFNDFIRPVCLPTLEITRSGFRGAQFEVVGWGSTREAGAGSTTPLVANIPHVEGPVCQEQYRQRLALRPEQQICAGTTGIDSCQGDSGGPLQYLSESTGRYYLVGVVSFGVGCARTGFPGVYSRVEYFLPWIRQNVQTF